MSHLIHQVLIYYVTFLVALERLTFTILYLGNIYIADSGNHRIRKVTVSTGIFTNIAGSGGTGSYSGDGGAATSAALNYPYGVALDSAGNYSL
jgi:DNA-binding beta-propeller fold protein YncE